MLLDNLRVSKYDDDDDDDGVNDGSARKKSINLFEVTIFLKLSR